MGWSGVVLLGGPTPHTLEKMEEGGLKRPWQGQEGSGLEERQESLLIAILTQPLRPVQGAECVP